VKSIRSQALDEKDVKKKNRVCQRAPHNPALSFSCFRGFSVNSKFGRGLDTIISFRCTALYQALANSFPWFAPGMITDHFQVIWNPIAKRCPSSDVSNWCVLYDSAESVLTPSQLSDVSAGLQYRRCLAPFCSIVCNGSFVAVHSCSVVHGDLTGVRGWFPEFITDDDHVCSPMSSSHPMGGPIYPTLVSPL
jgi:hypothetical protein